MATVVITLEGGLVQMVGSDVPNLRVIIADFDTEGATPGDTFEHPKVRGDFYLRDEIAPLLDDAEMAIVEVADQEYQATTL